MSARLNRIKRDIPIILNGITYEDSYEGYFEQRRALIYTLSFTAKTFMFNHIADTPEGLIKKVQLDYYSSVNTRTASRVQRYTVLPKAKKDYKIGKKQISLQVYTAYYKNILSEV